MPTPPAPAWISTVSPACRWPNSNRQSSAVPNATGTHATGDDVGAVGHGPGEDRGHRGELGVRAPEVRRDDPLPDVPVGHAGADLADRARALVTDDVRHGRHLAARAVEGVATLDADRLDLDEHAALVARRDRRRLRSGARRADRSRSTRRLSSAGCYGDELSSSPLAGQPALGTCERRRRAPRRPSVSSQRSSRAAASGAARRSDCGGRRAASPRSPSSARSPTIAYALRSVISSAVAMSRSRMPGSRAMHSRTRPCFVKKLQFAMPH